MTQKQYDLSYYFWLFPHAETTSTDLTSQSRSLIFLCKSTSLTAVSLDPCGFYYFESSIKEKQIESGIIVYVDYVI